MLSGFLLGIFVVPGQGALFSKKGAQTRGPAILEWNPSVRAEGMGGAYVGLSDDAGALFWNPAGLGQVERSEMAFGYSSEYGEQTRGDLRLVYPVWWGHERRTWGVRLAYASVNPFELTENGVSGETVHPQDYVFGISYEQPLGPLFVGGTIKGVRQDISVDAASTWATDVGLLGRGKRFRWGVSMTNLGPALKTNTGSLDLPLHFLGGGSWVFLQRKKGGKTDTGLAVFQLDAPIHDAPRPQVGIEWARQWKNRTEISGRMGYRSLEGDTSWMDKLTFGLGFSRHPFGINYAYLSQDDLGATHRFEFSWKFGMPLEKERRRNNLLMQAETLYKEGRMVRARAAVADVLVLSPNNRKAQQLRKKIDSRIATSLDPETLFILGDQAYSEGRYEQAVDLFRRLTEQAPRYPEGRERLEKAEEKAGAERLRVAELRVKEERDRELRSRRARAQKLMAQKKWSEAITAWGKVLELVPGDASVQKALGECREGAYRAASELDRRGEWNAAIDLYRVSQEGIKRYKGSQEKIEALSLSLESQGKKEAQRLYESGMAAYSAQEFEKARKLFEQALRANPKDKKALKALERLKVEMGRKP
jgi:tetratricopeptide (TPR) repeat protein